MPYCLLDRHQSQTHTKTTHRVSKNGRGEGMISTFSISKLQMSNGSTGESDRSRATWCSGVALLSTDPRGRRAGRNSSITEAAEQSGQRSRERRPSAQARESSKPTGRPRRSRPPACFQSRRTGLSCRTCGARPDVLHTPTHYIGYFCFCPKCCPVCPQGAARPPGSRRPGGILRL